jgi:jasmonate O-methyltransferase
VQFYQRVGVSIVVVGLSESWSFHCFVGLSVTSKNMEVEKVLHMNAGLGNSSYAQNSNLLQKSVIEIVEPMLEEAILSMKITVECKKFGIADLGCSSGPNALFAAENIIKSLKARYVSAGITVPQCQVFFNDLPASDFNSLFRNLPSVSVNTDNENEEGVADRSYFAAGVPGSFYGRLFPDKTLHFVHSSFSLHWLSQVPDDILEKNSVAWNKGKIFCAGSQAVGEAYFRQFQKDFNAFLRFRAEELVRGGRMFLLLLGRTSLVPSDQGFIALGWESLGNSLNDLASQGLIEEEKVDSFNLPLYAPCPEEVSSEVAREGSFEIIGMELLRKSETFTEEEMEAMTALSASVKDAYGRKLAKQLRAVTESLIKHHFGEEIIDALFERFGEIMGKRLSERMEYAKKGGHLVMVLERK